MSNFPYYSLDDLKQIKIAGIQPDDMTYPYDAKNVKEKRISQFLRNSNDVFVVSTQFKKPKYHFKVSQEIDIENPWAYGERAICCGNIQSAIKGTRVISYFFQFL